MSTPTYHDLYITTGTIQRTSIFNLPLGVMVTCTRVGGWEAWNRWDGVDELLGGEYNNQKGLRLDIDGHVIVDSLALVESKE